MRTFIAVLIMVGGWGLAAHAKGAAPMPKPMGAYAGEAERTTSDPLGCTWYSTVRLSVTFADDGSATWIGYAQSQGECTDSTPINTSCWNRGTASVEPHPKARRSLLMHATVTSNAAGPPLVEDDRRVWKCGPLMIVLPGGVEPTGPRCVLLGGYDDPREWALASKFCDIKKDFDALEGATLQWRGKALRVVAHLPSGRAIIMKPVPSAKKVPAPAPEEPPQNAPAPASQPASPPADSATRE